MRLLPLFIIVLVIWVKTNTFASVNKYSYHPYPVILIHGNSQTPYQPFGLLTSKDEEARPRQHRMSTKFNKDSIDYKKLGGVMINQFKSDSANRNSYWDYAPDSILNRPVYKYFQDTILSTRYYPYEEDTSYVGYNHTFVEAYCNYYQFESIDGGDPNYPTNKYKIIEPKFTAYRPLPQIQDTVKYNIVDGGQSQILRIRIIQTLNEYYGDYKCLNSDSSDGSDGSDVFYRV